MAWLRGRRRWATIAGVLMVALVAAVIVAWPYARRYAGVAPPAQFYREVQQDPALANDYARVIGVAHNAGNSLDTLHTALRYGADVIEIDVISARGQLVAGRNQPWPWLTRQVFRGPTLREAWAHAAAVDTIKLDLKQTDRAFLDHLIAFVAQRADEHRVLISSTDGNALRYLYGRVPGATMLFSVASPDAIAQLKSDAALQRVIGGASVAQGLVDASLISWLHEREMLILAWTVNDCQAFNRLVRLGVDGITTANLAILKALGG